MAVLVEHDAGIEIAVAIRVRAGPDEHLHARPLTVWGRAEVRVVGAGAVLGLGAHGIVADAAAPVVVDLEVAAGFVEAVLVLHVVDEVVQIEEIGHRRRTVGARRLRQVQLKVEGERRAAARTGIGVRGIVGVHVGIGLDVVALGRGELGPGNAIRVMPTEGRCRRIGRIHDQDAAVRGRQRARMVRTFRGQPVDAVLVAGDPVEARPHLAAVGIDREVPGMLFVERLNLEIPDQARFALADRQQHELAVDG